MPEINDDRPPCQRSKLQRTINGNATISGADNQQNVRASGRFRMQRIVIHCHKMPWIRQLPIVKNIVEDKAALYNSICPPANAGFRPNVQPIAIMSSIVVTESLIITQFVSCRLSCRSWYNKSHNICCQRFLYTEGNMRNKSIVTNYIVANDDTYGC
jgi:hypothetical protein